MANYLDSLNPAQKEAVLQKNGPMIIIAGAGSGKTRVLTYRIAHLMQQGVDAFNILSLTFTNKAAREMKERIEQQLAPLIKNIEARSQSEKIIVMALLAVGLVLAYLSIFYDPLSARVDQARRQISSTEAQIANQQVNYLEMMAASQEDPNKFANDRLVVISREQRVLDQEIANLAGDLVTPNQLTQQPSRFLLPAP